VHVLIEPHSLESGVKRDQKRNRVMNKTIRNLFSWILLLVLSACNLFGPPSAAVFENSVLRLTVQTQNNVTTFNQVGEVINYQYVVTNTGTSRLAGPLTVTDNPRQVQCPDVNTVGNRDIFLDQNETITCTAAYTVTQSDVTTGAIINVASASIGGVTSNQAGLTLTRGSGTPSGSSVLRLDKSASTQTYGAAGQTITYTFVITNTGSTELGPAQFTINDPKLGAPFNCGPAETRLAASQSVTCSVNYTVTSADMGLANITNSATAAGANQTSPADSVVVTNLAAPATQTPPVPATATPGTPSNLTPGSTIQHRVEVGEWLIQIVRCYGATFDEVRKANPQIADPDFILPAMTVTVPRIGSSGRIYGPPCITFHVVKSGDTWASIAQQYNADLVVLQKVNPATLTVGATVKVPRNSAGGTGAVITPVTPVTPAVTLSPTPTGTTIAPMRITFPPGSTTDSRIGLINPGQTLQYIVNAAPGQVLSIQLTATPANEVAIGVTGPTGLALKPLDTNPQWSTTITTGGDHMINLASIAGTSSKSYTLQVSLTTPGSTAVPATATATGTPPTPAGQSNAGPIRANAP
jgi:hypothetical protein